MGLAEDLQRLVAQINERIPHVINEEMTKQTLIIPFLQVLGYDVFNPLEVKPEYLADFGKKKSEKVDYAIFKDNTPIIVIEAKSVQDDPKTYNSQLARYFNSLPQVRLAMLTNGRLYKFYTDLDTNNIMDENPFFTMDLTNLSESDISILETFRKDSFDTGILLELAEELTYTSNLNNKLKAIFRNPPDEFVRYLIRDFTDTKITTNVIERFRPIVKRAITETLLDMVSQGLFQEDARSHAENDNGNGGEASQKDSPRQVITTQEELKSFECIREILEKNGRDVSQLGCRDRVSYFVVYFKNLHGWFLRLNLDSSNKHIICKLPVGQVQPLCGGYKVEQVPNGSRVLISSCDDLKELTSFILACYDSVARS